MPRVLPCTIVLCCLLVAPAAIAQQPLPAPEAPVSPPVTEQPAQPAPVPAASTAPVSSQSTATPVVTDTTQPAGADRLVGNPLATSRDLSKDFWALSVGGRASWHGDRGLDPFATGDVVGSVSIAGSRTLLIRDRVSIAGGLYVENGLTDATARGQSSRLHWVSIGVLAEGRYHLFRDLFALARLSPHALYSSARIEDASSPAPLDDVSWGFGLDASLGLAANVSRPLAGKSFPEFWLVAEYGYGWNQSRDLNLRPDLDESDPRSTQTLKLGSLSLSGQFLRVSGLLAF